MSRTLFNFLLDALLLSFTVALLFVSAVVRLVFPAPTQAEGWTLLGRGYNAWANFQFGLVCVIGGAILLHVMLHWSWVCGVVTSKLMRRKGPSAKLDDGARTLYGVGLLIAVLMLLGALVAGATFLIQPPTVG